MLSYRLIEQYEILIVFLNMFGSSLGLPLPAAPTLVMVGASLSRATGGMSPTLTQLGEVVVAAVIGGIFGDFVWFQCGKFYGLRSLCGIYSLLTARQTCIEHMEQCFGRWGVRVLLIARFVPGLSLLSVPLCGAMAVRLRTFILHDGAGIALWTSVDLAVGALFASRIDRAFGLFLHFGGRALIAIALAYVLFVSYRHLRRGLHEETNNRSQIGTGVSSVRVPEKAASSSVRQF